MQDNEWNPNAPDLGHDFDAAKDNTRPGPEKTSEQVQGIATKDELEMRKNQRQAPVLESHLTLDGEVNKTVRQKEHDENEARIKYLERRLTQRNLKREFNRSR